MNERRIMKSDANMRNENFSWRNLDRLMQKSVGMLDSVNWKREPRTQKNGFKGNDKGLKKRLRGYWMKTSKSTLLPPFPPSTLNLFSPTSFTNRSSVIINVSLSCCLVRTAHRNMETLQRKNEQLQDLVDNYRRH